jgi:hypothetical protein
MIAEYFFLRFTLVRQRGSDKTLRKGLLRPRVISYPHDLTELLLPMSPHIPRYSAHCQTDDLTWSSRRPPIVLETTTMLDRTESLLMQAKEALEAKEYPKAEQLQRQACELIREKGEDDSRLATEVEKLADIHYVQHKLDESAVSPEVETWWMTSS